MPTTFTAYDKTYVYILDACEDKINSKETDIASEHYQKQRIMRRLFQKHFDEEKTEVIDVIFQPRTKPDVVIGYFEKQLSDKSNTDLVLIYFDGGAGNNGEDYVW